MKQPQHNIERLADRLVRCVDLGCSPSLDLLGDCVDRMREANVVLEKVAALPCLLLLVGSDCDTLGWTDEASCGACVARRALRR